MGDQVLKTDTCFPNEITLLHFSKRYHLHCLVLPLALPQLLLVFSSTFLAAAELRPAGVSPFSWRVNCFFSVQIEATCTFTDRFLPNGSTYTLTKWEEFCRDGCSSAAPAVFWGTAVPFFLWGSNFCPCPGHAARGCQGNVCRQLFPSPAQQPLLENAAAVILAFHPA